MSFKEYIELDGLMWKGKHTKRAEQLLNKWDNLPEETKKDFQRKKYELEFKTLNSKN